MYVGNNFFIKNSFYLYILGNIFLILLLIFARPINDSKCWFEIKGIGTIQPSEFMKIILILYLSKVIDDFKKKYPNPTIREEFIFLLKIIFIVAIPSILTFLEPDTGVVLIYLLITLIMLFISGVRLRWFIILILLCSLSIGGLLFLYFESKDLFIKFFGTSFFLRIDRILDWQNKSGFQLEHSLFSIGSAGLFGYGIKNTPLYFPEAHTDFIFAVYASNFGLIGSLFLICLLLYFDLRLIKTALKTNNNIYKYITAGIVGMLIYQQFQNIGMTFGIMPITGITLPLISYGGSSLLSYMFMIGIIFNISNEAIRYHNT
jgi:rod shape determining protein RodA